MFNQLLSQAASMLQSAAPQDVAGATREHVEQTDPQTLANHLTSGAQNLDGASLGKLGQMLLDALAQHGHDESKMQDGGIDTQAAANGDQSNVVSLIEHAQQNPAALRDAAVRFVEQDPQVLTQLPGLVEGVLGRLSAK